MDKTTSRYAHDEARHNAEETLRMVNADLRNPRNAHNARRRHQLTQMKRDAMETISHHDRMYRGTNDRYNDDYRNDDDRRMDMVHDAMDMVDRILPHITGDDMDDNYNDVINRRGVPGTGPYSRRRRGRGGRGRIRVGGYTRRRPRMDADDWNDDFNDMDDWNDIENRRKRDRFGRFTSDADDRMMDNMVRTVATAAADTARRMMDDRTTRSDYSPVMPQNDDRRTMDERTHNERSDTSIGPRR